MTVALVGMRIVPRLNQWVVADRGLFGLGVGVLLGIVMKTRAFLRLNADSRGFSFISSLGHL